jgi:predicted acetyltransferase
MALDIRTLTDDELDTAVRIVGDAYPGLRVFTAADRDRLMERVRQAPAESHATRYGAFRDDEMVGLMRIYDYQMNVRGTKLLTGGLGGVAVHLAHKKEHVAKEMVEFFHQRSLKEGASMAVLWPFRTDFYRKMGYGLGSPLYEYRIMPSSLPASGDRSRVRYLTEDDIAAVSDCYHRVAARTPGLIDTPTTTWESYFRDPSEPRWVGYVDGAQLAGYIVFRW